MRFLSCILTLSIIFCVMCVNAELSPEEDEDKIAYEKYLAIDNNLKHFAGNAVVKLLPLIKRTNEILNISSRCDRDITRLISDVGKLKLSAFQFLDAMGKPAEGIMEGSFMMAGDYDQCLSSRILHENGDVAFKGQYCMLICKPPLPKKRYPLTIDGGSEEFVEQTKNLTEVVQFVVSILQFYYVFPTKFGACVPSGCSTDDMNRLTNYVGEQIYATITVDYCEKEDDTHPTTMKTISICVFSILGALVVVGTIVDSFCNESKSKGYEALICFSVARNFPKIIDTRIEDGSLSCLHGIRALTLLLVILLHHYAIPGKFFFNDHIFKIMKQPHLLKNQVISNGFLFIDILFLLGGVLNAYTRFKIHEKRSVGLREIIIHRLWRLYPTYISSILLIYIFETRGPYSRFLYDQLWSNCNHEWWKNLIFINNYFDQMGSCLPQAWYVAADMQLFLISLFTIPTLLKSAKKGLFLNFAVVCAGIIGTLILSWYTKVLPSAIPYRVEYKDFYDYYNVYAHALPHTAPYFIGILLGYFLYSTEDLNLSKGVQIVGWLTAPVVFLSTLLITVFWNSGVEITLTESILYFTFSKILFVLPVCWVVMCCSRGYGGVVNYILSLKMWIPLARISFMIFTVSIIIQLKYAGNRKTATDFDDMIMLWTYCGDVVVSCLFAVGMVLLVESPFIRIGKLLFQGQAEKPKDHGTHNSVERKIAATDDKKEI